MTITDYREKIAWEGRSTILGKRGEKERISRGKRNAVHQKKEEKKVLENL